MSVNIWGAWRDGLCQGVRLQLLSDLHFEFHRDHGHSFVESLRPAGVDVLVLAGDIAVAGGIPDALGLLCRRYRDAKVVYVHGNHEFYKTDRRTVVELTESALAKNDNLVWLDASSVEISGTRFLGAPLWFPRREIEVRLKQAMTDFSVIVDFESWVYDEHARAVAFFERHLREGDVVITHHLPSQRCVAPRFVGHPLNPFFVSDLEALILERRPRLWLHGHTHNSVRVEVGATTVSCNPFGYVGHELNREFSDDLVFDTDATVTRRGS
jgi:predicted phosphodiesterase